MRKASLLILFGSQLLVILGFWAWNHVHHPLGNLLTGDAAGQCLAYGRLAGLLAAFFILLQILMVGRIGWVERAFGLDSLTRIHHVAGFSLVLFLVAHPVLVTFGHALQADAGYGEQMLDFFKNWEGVLSAAIGTAIMLAAVGVSIAIIRKRWSYEAWHASHFLIYLAIALAFGHQIAVGSDFADHPAFRLYWVVLYLFVFGNLVLYRIGRPLWKYWRHRFRVARLVSESPDVTSVYIAGRAMECFRVEGGQFVMVRFLSPNLRWQVHPFSISAPPDGRGIRLTIKQLGDYTRQIPALVAGTPVIMDGPHGVFTAHRCKSDKVLLIAGGIGITPVRAISDRLLASGQDIILLYAHREAAGIVVRQELDGLAAAFPGRFRIIHVLNHDPDWAGEKGTIDEALIRRLVPDVADRDVYLCGPPPMMKVIRVVLKRLNVCRVYSERFSL